MNLRIPVLFLMVSVCPLLAGSPRDLLGAVVNSDAIKQFCAAHELTPAGRNVKENFIPLTEKEGTRVTWVETVRLKEKQRAVTYVLIRHGFEERDPFAAGNPRQVPFTVDFAEIEEKAVVDCFPKSGELNWHSRPDDVYKVFGRGEWDIVDELKVRHINYWAGPLAGTPPYQFSFSGDGGMTKVILYSTR